MEFSEVISSIEQLREVMGYPADSNIQKVIATLDDHCRAFIAKSPFMLMASSDASGRLDVSPKGDPPGFVQVLDDQTLAIPDRIGNRRADTFTNILQNAGVGLLFMIPGKRETLRINGSAVIVRDERLRRQLACQGKIPDLALVVAVKEVFMHCGKSTIRSKIWEPEHWPDLEGISSLAQVLTGLFGFVPGNKLRNSSPVRADAVRPPYPEGFPCTDSPASSAHPSSGRAQSPTCSPP